MDEKVLLNPDEEISPREDVFDYDFLKPEKEADTPKETNENIVVTQFDTAFTNSSKAIQDYILGEKLEESVRLICKIERLEEEKAQVIIENIAVSILVGLLPINEAKETLIESFRSSGIVLESFTASSILKSIDSYILTDIRKKILESKLENKREIRHLTLKEKREEFEKEELRKILLERTGTISGKGKILIQYKERENTSGQTVKEIDQKNIEDSKKQEMNRESLLAKINMQNISDTDKIRERMAQIKKEEDGRIQRVLVKEKNEEERVSEIKNKESEQDRETASPKIENREVSKEENSSFKDEEMRQVLIENLKEKLLSNEDEKVDLNILRQDREKEEVQIQKAKNNDFYKNSMAQDFEEPDSSNFDPYREGF